MSWRQEDLDPSGPSPRFRPGTMVVLQEDAADLEGRRIARGTACRVTGLAPGGHLRLETAAGRQLDVSPEAVVLQRGGPDRLLGEPLAPAAAWERYRDHIHLVTLVGSAAWGLTQAGSDEDHRGVFLAPFGDVTGLRPVPGQVDEPGRDASFWELEKLVRHALRADPNALEALHGPVVRATAFGERVLATREAFLSRRVLGTFGRYALAQLERIQGRARRNRLMEELAALWRAQPKLAVPAVMDHLALRLSDREGLAPKPAHKAAKEVLKDLARSLCDRGLIPDRRPESAREWLAASGPRDEGWLAARSDKPKNAVHLLRILHSGLQLLEGRGPLIRVEEPLRARLLEVRRGEVPLETVLAEARAVARRMEEACVASPLPEEPDLEAAEALLREGRRLAYAQAVGVRAAWPVRPVARDPVRAPHPLPQDLLEGFLAQRPERVFLAAVSGAHAYGFPSPDSDVDLKAIHLAPVRRVLGLGRSPETADVTAVRDGVEVDYTSHELGKACAMLLAGDGNLLERVLSAYPVVEHPRARELRALAQRNLHLGYHRHYRGFSRSLLQEFEKGLASGRPRVKPLLYAFRTALTGRRLLEDGACDADLTRQLDRYPEFARVAELIELKATAEHAELPDGEAWLTLARRAQDALEAAAAASSLPAAPPAAEELSSWLAEVRLGEG